MAHSQFQPTIEYNFGKIRVTLPVDQRSKFWDAFGDEARKVVNLNGLNRTQVAIEPLPGQSSRKTYVLVLTVVAFATYPGTFEEFWANDSVLDLVNDFVIEGYKKEPVTAEDVEFALRLIVAEKADSKIYIATQEVERLPYRDDLNHDYQEMVLAYRRLAFADPKATFLTREEWESRLTTCQDLLGVIAAKSGELAAVNTRIGEIQKRAVALRQEFAGYVHEVLTGQLPLRILQFQYNAIKAELKLLANDHADLYGRIDITAANEAISEIKFLTPPASK